MGHRAGGCWSLLSARSVWAKLGCVPPTVPGKLPLTAAGPAPETQLHRLQVELQLSFSSFVPTFHLSSLLHFLSFYSCVLQNEIHRFFHLRIFFLPSHSQVALVVKNPLANAGDKRNSGSIPGSGRSPGGRKGKPLQDSCLENSRDRGVWWATVDGVTKSGTWLSSLAHMRSTESQHPVSPSLGVGCSQKRLLCCWELLTLFCSSFSGIFAPVPQV